jgi:YVTN family beta-propeller protein
VYDPDKGRVFVSNYNSTSLSVISDNNNTVIANLPLQMQPQGMAFDSGKNELFITYSESNKVSVIADSAALPQGQTGQTLHEFTALALILLVTAVGFLVVNLVHLKSKRQDKSSKFSQRSGLDGYLRKKY